MNISSHSIQWSVSIEAFWQLSHFLLPTFALVSQAYPALPSFHRLNQPSPSGELCCVSDRCLTSHSLLFTVKSFSPKHPISSSTHLGGDAAACFQQHTAPYAVNWLARRAVGGITGPPVETGATLPFRELPAAVSVSQATKPPSGMSRSITSGARQAQPSAAQPQHSQLIPTPTPQPTLPTAASSESQSPRSQPDIIFVQSSAPQFPLSSAVQMTPSLPTWSASTHVGPALPNTTPAGISAAVSGPSSQPLCNSVIASQPTHMALPLQHNAPARAHSPSVSQPVDAQHQAELELTEADRQHCRSNQPTESHQARQLERRVGSLSASDDCLLADKDSMHKGAVDGGSDSAAMSGRDCRQSRCFTA